MFERYTQNARRTLFFARYEASQFGDIEIKAEHLLIGLARASTGMAARIFTERGISLQDIRGDIESASQFREKVSTSVEIPFSEETKRVLQFAAEEADNLRHHDIGTEHLLLGILREEKSAAATVLHTRGLRLNEVRDAVEKLVAEAPSRSASSHRTETAALIHGINQLLERLSALRPDDHEGRTVIDEIRQRVNALERHLGR